MGVRIHYDIPDDTHRRAKTAAAAAGVTLKEFVIEALNDAADRHQEKKP